MRRRGSHVEGDDVKRNGTRARRVSLRGVVPLVAMSLLADVGLADAARSCAGSCVSRMVSCRAERCPGATGNDRRHCRDLCRAVTGCAAGAARTRTIATVVNECRSAGGMWTGRQRLEIRRGDCPPVSVIEGEANEPAVDLVGSCAIYGRFPQGAAAMSIGALEGVAVSRDGETVIFQMTDDFIGRLPIPSPRFTLAEEGIFVVRSDGSDLHWIAEQSREAPFAIRPSPDSSLGPISVVNWNGFDFSPDGKTVVFVDRGPGSDGSDAPQLFTLDPVTGARRQLTTFTASSVGAGEANSLDIQGVFLDDRRIGAFVFDPVKGPRIFTIARDGTDIRFIEDLSAIPGATVVPDFGLIGVASAVFSLAFPDRLTDQPRPGPVREIFVRNGDKTLQLTNYGRSDTSFPTRLRGGRQVVFRASADPVRRNRKHASQLFRIDRLGGHVRQLTRFEPSGTGLTDCTGTPMGRCRLVINVPTKQDPVSRTLLFDSSCDPLGLGAATQQLYVVRPNGTGLRQLTSYRGLTCDDGAVNVELPGPIAYSAPFL